MSWVSPGIKECMSTQWHKGTFHALLLSHTYLYMYMYTVTYTQYYCI